MKKYLFFLIVSIGIFAISHHSSAATFGSQTDIASSTGYYSINMFVSSPASSSQISGTAYLGLLEQSSTFGLDGANIAFYAYDTNLDGTCGDEGTALTLYDGWNTSQVDYEAPSLAYPGKVLGIIHTSGTGFINGHTFPGWLSNMCYKIGMGAAGTNVGLYGANTTFQMNTSNSGIEHLFVPWMVMGDSTSSIVNFSPTATPSILFNFPVDGTTTAPFNFLSATISGLTPSSTYAITEVTTYNGKNVYGQQMQNTGAYFSRFGYSTPFPIINDIGFGSDFGMVSEIDLYDITQNGYLSSVQLPNVSSSIHWALIPYINNGFNEVNGTTTIRDTFPIYVQATSTNPVTTPWDGNIVNGTTTNPLINTTSTFTCAPPDSLTDIAGGLAYGVCYGWNFISTRAQTAASDLLSITFNGAQHVFPFSIPLTLYQNFSQSASSTLSSSTDAMISFTLPYCNPLCTATSGRTMIIMSSSTKVYYVSDQWFQLQVYIYDLVIILVIFFTARHGRIHHKKNSKSQ